MTDRPPRPCLRSGTCCKKAVCPFGIWDADLGRCAHLRVVEVVAGTDVHACAIKEEIEIQPGAWISPAFGAGCCMPLFNEARDRLAAAARC